MDVDRDHRFRFTLVDQPHGIRTYSIIRDALIEAAVINFRQVFSSGSKSKRYGIADNQRNSNVCRIRDELKKVTLIKLGWTSKEFDTIFNLIKEQRNGLLAHYDGEVGNYRELEVGLSSRKMSGIHISKIEKEKFEVLVKTMYEVVFDFLYVENSKYDFSKI